MTTKALSVTPPLYTHSHPPPPPHTQCNPCADIWLIRSALERSSDPLSPLRYIRCALDRSHGLLPRLNAGVVGTLHKQNKKKTAKYLDLLPTADGQHLVTRNPLGPVLHSPNQWW